MRAVRHLILWPTARCPLDCVYCYRTLREGTPMSERTAHRALDLAEAGGAPFHIQFAGGEPTLAPDLIASVVERVRSRGLPATIAVQTNGTLITDGLARLFAEGDVEVGVSLDGPVPVHDRLRSQGARTLRGLRTLSEHGVGVQVTAVLTAVNADHLSELALLLAGVPTVRGLALDPLVLSGSAVGRADLLCTAPQIVEAVRRLYERIVQVERVRGTRLTWRELELVRRSLDPGEAPGPVRDYCHAVRGESLAVAPDGSVHPCSRAVGCRELSAGAVHDVDRGALLRAFAGTARLTGPCADCPLSGRCPGDCPSRLSTVPPDTEAAMCLIYRTLAELEAR
ncbi:MAG: uncharacterized protein QG608_1587 [Actinomycetota bacterium]|nr:uncharacterized protein [Actinomycetota bacterium]